MEALPTTIVAALCAWLAAFVLGLLGTAVVRRLAPRLGLVDLPEPRKVHVRPMPLGGGVAVWAAVTLVVALAYLLAWAVAHGLVPPSFVPEELRIHVPGFLSRGPLVAAVIAAGTVQMGLGLVDDWRGLSYVFRLVVEVLLVLLLAWLGVRVTLFPPFDTPVLTYAVTVLWVVGLTNAFNFLDNMDALSSGTAAICCVFIALVAVMIGDLFIAGFVLVLCGAVLGFLVFNWPPATIFLGDAGSNYIGFLLGVVTVAGTFTTADYPTVTIFAPLCIMAVPIYDSISVVCIRLAEGRSPFKPDKSHFSHRLVQLGLSPERAVLTIYLATTATSLSAIVLYFLPPRWAPVVLLQLAAVLGLVAVLETTGVRSLKQNAHNGHQNTTQAAPQEATRS